jgi:hypothetical protein
MHVGQLTIASSPAATNLDAVTRLGKRKACTVAVVSVRAAAVRASCLAVELDGDVQFAGRKTIIFILSGVSHC